MTDLHQPLGDRLRARRTKRGWSLRRLAKESGVTHSMIDRIERSRCDMRLSDYEKLCRALKIRVRIIL